METSSKSKVWNKVSLRLMGDKLPVDELEDRLGLVPSSLGKKGELYRNHSEYQTNVWVWRYPSDSKVPLREQVQSLLDVIEPKTNVLTAIIIESGAKAELFLGTNLAKDEIALSDALLKRISSLGLSVDWDLY